MGVLELIQQKAFLGNEFLTWVWFRAETAATIDLGQGRSVEVEMLGPIALDAHYGDARALALKGDSPATSPEATTALIQGKKLAKARIKLSREDVDWIATLDAQTFNISGLNVPKAGQLPFDEALNFRFEYVMEFDRLLGELFDVFIELRLNEKEWAAEIKQIHAWVDER